jgi:adenylate cyclase
MKRSQNRRMHVPRAAGFEPSLFRFKDYVLDGPDGCLRTADGQEVELRPKSFEVLRYLLASPGRLVTKEEMLKAVWPNVVVSDESLAQCVSEVRRAIRDEDQTTIKTVPRRGYRFVAPVHRLDASGSSAATGAAPSVPEHASLPLNASRPAIAILPFVNLSGDPGQDYFSDGVTEDIITELSRFSELLVIARNSSFQYRGKAMDIRHIAKELGAGYVLEGSMRRDGDRVRVTAQLVDANTGGHLWAERYDRRIDDVFAVQDDLAHAIAAVLAVQVSKAEARSVLLKPPSGWKAYEFYLRGAEAYRLRGQSRSAVHDAAGLVNDSLSTDPNYARAYALLSKILWWNYVEPGGDEYLRPQSLERAHALAQRAVQLAPELPDAHAQLGWTSLFMRQHSEGLTEFERAFALNRNFVDNRFALALAYAGKPQDGIDFLRAHIQLDPFQPFDSFGFLGHAHYMLGSYRQAVAALAVYPSRAPAVRVLALWLAAAHAQAGDIESARAQAQQVLLLEPSFTIAAWARTAVYQRTKDAEHLFAGLRQAGLPQN